MLFGKYIIEFTIYSFLGWIWETIYAVFKTHKWESRGFLIGPACPIYGFSVIIGMLLCNKYYSVINNSSDILKVFILSMFVSVIIEYTTSYLLEKFFNAYWWDYHNMPLNINGRVCLPATLFFGVIGVFFVYILFPLTNRLILNLNSVVIEVLSYIFIIIFAVDLTLTLNELCELNSIIRRIDKSFNDSIEVQVANYFKKEEVLRKIVLSKIQRVNYSDKVMKVLSKIKHIDIIKTVNKVLRIGNGRVKKIRKNNK